MNKEILATILGVASLSLVKKMGSPSKLMHFYGQPEAIEAVIKDILIDLPMASGNDDYAELAIFRLKENAGNIKELSEIVQNLTEIHPNNTSTEDFLNFLNEFRLYDVSEEMTERIYDMEDDPFASTVYISLLYNLKSIKLVFREDSVVTRQILEPVTHQKTQVTFDIHCTFKFTNTESEIKNMMKHIEFLISSDLSHELFGRTYTGSIEIDPQNKLSEKMKKHVFGTTSSQLRRF